MTVHRRRVAEGPYVPMTSTSPLSRVCPECEARPGERCWGKSTVYPKRIERIHKGRRISRTPADEKEQQ